MGSNPTSSATHPFRFPSSAVSDEFLACFRGLTAMVHLRDSFVTKARDKKAALKFLKKAMRKHGRPEVIVTDRLRSYGAALREIGAADRQETGRWLNNRAENSHLPFWRRERAMLRYRCMRTLQKFAAVHASVLNHFNSERSLTSRSTFKLNRAAALAEWRLLCSA